MDKIARIHELIDLLNKHSTLYYKEDNPQISDAQYDKLYYELVALEKDTGEYLPYSPTQRVGDEVLKSFEKYTHKSKLWSMDKAQSINELNTWHIKNVKFIEDYNRSHERKLPEVSYIITKKFDGLTINCTYNEEGILTKAATRGTGEVGEDVTGQARTIKTLPLKIPYNHVCEIHGEAIMTKEAFEKYNKESQIPLKNLRNGAAGALRNLNIKETAKRGLSAFFYDVGYNEGEPFESYEDMMKFIKDMGLPVDAYLKKVTTMKEIEEEIRYIESIRPELNYDIDGVVIAINHIVTRELIGNTIKFPKWAIAYKFEAEETTTKVLQVEWNVSRNGRVTPTAILEPVDLAGVTVKRATLNNMDDIRRKRVKIGSDVFIRRSNDVIPEIMGIAKEDEEGTTEINPPESCPYCHSPLIQDGAHYFCENTLSCKPQLVKSIVHFGSREAMNIDGFSDKTCEQLYEKLNIESISDLYKINKEQLLTLEKFGDKKASNLINAIEKSKDCDLASFIYALGIPNVGKKTAADLAKTFKSFEKLKIAEIEELTSIKDVGEVVAECIIKFFKDELICKSIEELFILGVSPKFIETEVTMNPFLDKTVVITGTLEGYSRTEIKEKLESLGAKVSSSVSKNTDYVIVGENPGSKYDKAVELGLKILGENELKLYFEQ